MKFRKYHTFLVFLFWGIVAHAQQASISGSIADTINFKPMAYSSIALIRQSDSVLVSHQWATEKADFTFGQLVAGNYILQITRPTFADYEELIRLGENEQKQVGTIVLVSKEHLLKEIIVREKKNAITIKGDTTEYLVDSFLVNKSSNVEDLLKKLPGIQVDKNGKITAHGQEVKKVLVDGEEFFGEDPTVATKNIRADNVESVQVFDKKSDQAAFTGIEDGEKNKTINLKLKDDAKKGYFGKASGAEGRDENKIRRYEYDAMANMFKNKRKFSVYGATSNTNKTDMDWNDREKYQGSNDNTFMSDEGYYYSYYDGNDGFNGVGVPQTIYYGGFYSDKLKDDKHTFNINASHKEMLVNGYNNNYTKYILPDTLYFNNQKSEFNNTKQKNSGSGKYEIKLDSLSTLKVTLSASQGTFNNKSTYTTENLNSNAALVNSNNRLQTNIGDNQTFKGGIVLNKKFKTKGRTISLNTSFDYNANSSDGFLESETKLYNADGSLQSATLIDQKKTNSSKTNSIIGNIVYTEPLSDKWFVVSEYDLKTTVSESKRYTFTKNVNNEYTDPLDSLSNSLRYDIFVNAGGISLKYVNKKLNYSFGGKASYTDLRQLNQVSNQVSNQYFLNLFPAANIQYKLRNNTSFRASYNGSTRQPSLQQIQPLLDNSNPLDLYVGNPGLQQSFRNGFNVSFNDYKALSGRSFYGSLSYDFTQNDFTSYDIVDNQGRKTHKTVNVDGNKSANLWTNYWFSIKKIDLGVSQNASMNYSVNNNFINGLSNRNQNISARYGLGFYYDIEEKFECNAGANINYNYSTSSLRSDIKTAYFIYNYDAGFSVFLPKQFKTGADVDINIRQRTSDFDKNLNNTIVNAYVSKGFLKKETLVIKFSIHDLLNQNLGFNRTANSNYINENTFSVLRRYFLVSLTWNFRRGGTGE
ncbi:MAG: outer membrane beta-barrel protein [Bacteroidota bacterium]